MKYVGSKQKISKYIVPIIQKYIDDNKITQYIEPFVGGASIIDKIDCNFKYGFDIDEIPISIFNHYKKFPQDLDRLPKIISKEDFYKIRDDKSYPNWFRSSIMLFASYNSRVYGGCYGAMAKIKDGTIRNYYQEAINNLRKQLPLLKNIKFQQMDYKDLIAENCVIYNDPPYTSGIGYSIKFDHNKFWNWVREMSKNNIVITSEYEAPDDFECIWEMPVKTHMNNRNKLNKIEKLFIWKGNKNEN